VEETILTAIANARAGLMTARTPDEKLAANDRLNVALLPLMRMQENYPQLKSNDQFMRLEDELAGTENRIAVSRLRYNAAIKDYNVFIQQFPTMCGRGWRGTMRRRSTTLPTRGRRLRRRWTSRSRGWGRRKAVAWATAFLRLREMSRSSGCIAGAAGLKDKYGDSGFARMTT